MNIFKSDFKDNSINASASDGDSQNVDFPSTPFIDVCGMCGRTILTGEKTEHYTARDDGRSVIVCSHCREAAKIAGLRRGSVERNP